ncbi:MAG TPA: tetratricopeptide repeat protein [Verrucomicrobiae bacterium]|nr:tetratricopeptide repeat protein [Verrucomicrobiae bacterium]
MHSYGVKDVEKLLRLPRSTIRALIAAGFVVPQKLGKALRFSFQDLIVLRTAQALASAKIPAKRINASLKALRKQLPDAMPLSGLSIGAAGNHVVIRDGSSRRVIDSGQYLLGFEGNPESGALKVVEPKALVGGAFVGKPLPQQQNEAEQLYEQGAELEQAGDREGAIKAYERAVAEDALRLDAHINLGRLLHEAGRLAQAEAAYRAGLISCGKDAVLLFNLGVLLEDRGRDADAIKAYDDALAGDSGLADCHYNLSLLHQKQNKPREALRHMAQYRRLMSRCPPAD